MHFKIPVMITACLFVSSPSIAITPPFDAIVVGVSDGDTLTALTNTPCTGEKYCRQGKTLLRVRLAEIDTPEKGQPYGTKAKKALSDRVFGKQIQIRSTGSDRYGRVIGNVYHAGRWVNEDMVGEGHAWVYRQYSKTPRLLLLEASAKQNGLGLWSLPAPERIPPWEWRRKSSR